jgi:hypothetical protein
VLTGTVTKVMLLHGALVDVGFDHDGLIPIPGEDAWDEVKVHGAPMPGDSVSVRVHAVRDRSIYRFPLQLAPTDEPLASCVPPPDSWTPPLDLRYFDGDLEALARRTGRKWEPARATLRFKTVDGAGVDADVYGEEDDLSFAPEDASTPTVEVEGDEEREKRSKREKKLKEQREARAEAEQGGEGGRAGRRERALERRMDAVVEALTGTLF